MSRANSHDQVVKSQPSSSPGNGDSGCATSLIATLGTIFMQRRRKKAKVHVPNAPVEKALQVHLGQLKKFSFRELQSATDNFNPKCIVGQGGFARVYKGRLYDGSLVAVKRFKEEHTQVEKHQFQTELELIAMAVHRNLLRLRGFCTTPTERLLVYPFLVNGSVASWLRERPKTQPPLSWKVRKRIALGAARGLAYLHDHCNPKIIHRDVKAANILLDEEFEAVVADFGLVKFMDPQDSHITTEARGTMGYIAPEYLWTKKSSEKTDVFGYGIMLLELLIGQRVSKLARRAEANADDDDDFLPLDWVKRLFEDKKLGTLIDVDLHGNYAEEEAEQLTLIALLCTQSTPRGRPKMSEVIKMLEGDGLAERWEKWQTKEMFHQEFNYTRHPSADWIVDSTSLLNSEELSGPR